jgi:HK97 family phage major capsid protein
MKPKLKTFTAWGLWAGALALLAMFAPDLNLGITAGLGALTSLDPQFLAPLGVLPLLGFVGDAEVRDAVESVKRTVADKFNECRTATDRLQDKLIALERMQLARSSSAGLSRPGEVSLECARHLGGIALLAGIRQGHLRGDRVEGLAREIFGVEVKAALTTADIPLPTAFSGQVVELVSSFGTARRYGTVFPLGTGTVKLPRIKTDPTFGLIAMSAPVTEVSPQVEFVTFNAEKFGGLIRLPSEMDDDSVVGIGQFIARYAARNIARVEDHNFWIGTGAGSGINGSVEGLTVSTITNSMVHQMASTKTKYSDSTLTDFRTLRTVVDEAALAMGAYYLHPTFEAHLAGFNTSGDRPYNPQAQIAGTGTNPLTTGPTLDGFPIRWVNTLPAFSTAANVSKVFGLFGDPSYQYLGVRGEMRFDISRDAGFTTDEILIRALERLTIGLMALGAVGGLQTAAS